MKMKIEIDSSAWFTEKGVEVTTFIGNCDEPVVEITELYKDLIDKELDAHRFPDGTIDERAEDFVLALESAAAYARKELEFRRG